MPNPTLWQNVRDDATRRALQEIAGLLQASPVAAFRAYRQQALILPNPKVAKTHITFDAVEYDYEREYDRATGFWVPKHSGPYLVTAGVALNTAQGDQQQVELYLFNNEVRERFLFYNNTSGATAAPQVNSADVVMAQAGHYYDVRITVAVNSTAIYTGPDATWFSATLLRQPA